MTRPEESVLVVRRSVYIKAPPARVWQEFTDLERMKQWWGLVIGKSEAGQANGMQLNAYEARMGGRVEMEVGMDGEAARFGGPIVALVPSRELTIENDWIPNRGWGAPTHLTLRLTAVLDGTLVELFHHGFERTGGDVGAEHAGYEQGWGMTQLNALKHVVES